MPDSRSIRCVAVIGGGITGLAAAHRLHELSASLEVSLFEAGPRPGGVLYTQEVGGFLLEHAADNFITSAPWGLDLCRRIGLEGELLPTDASRRRAFVVRRGRLHAVPDGFLLMAPRRLWPIVTTPLLSVGGKLRLLCEWLVPRRRAAGEESLAAFATRRLGREAFERLVEPMVAGIYTADAKKLSVAAALPQFTAMEQEHGSLLKAALRARREAAGQSGARYSLFVAPRRGMSQLVEALAARLPPGTLRLNAAVSQLRLSSNARWSVTLAGQHTPESFDGVIVAAPACAAAPMLRDQAPALADELAAIPYAPSIVVCLGYQRDQIAHRLDGFGFVVPAIENRPILAASFSSLKYPGRAPEGQVLIRVFFSVGRQRDWEHSDDGELQQVAQRELAALLGVRGEPSLCRVIRWQNAMPQYHVGHLERLARIAQRLHELPGLQLAGNAYDGVGVPQCIHSGEQAAERVVKGEE